MYLTPIFLLIKQYSISWIIMPVKGIVSSLSVNSRITFSGHWTRINPLLHGYICPSNYKYKRTNTGQYNQESIYGKEIKMVDNSWIKKDSNPSNLSQKGAMRTKVIITIAIILIGVVATIALNGVGSNATQYRSQGIVVDYGDYLTMWTDADFNIDEDPVSLLEKAKEDHKSESFDYTIADGKLTSITYNGTEYRNSDSKTWDLWYVPEGTGDLVKSETYDIKASDYTVVIWAYTSVDGMPMPAVDATMTSIYGYSEPMKVVSLSPVCTETVSAVGAVSKIVGTDSYSDYPQYVVEGKKNGSIAIVGSYTDPSYEAIMNTAPEMVFCDASTYNDVQMAGMLRSSNVNSVVLYNGEDVETIMKNIFITGTAIGYNQGSQAYIQNVQFYIKEIQEKVAGAEGFSTMVALSNDPSPWIAGMYTYIDDIIGQVGGTNTFHTEKGWTNVTPESITKHNPDCIIIIDSYKYKADEYDEMLSILSHEWKSTNAYKNGNIYLLAEDAGSLGSRSGPRFVQLMELMAMMIDPSAFADNPLPKSIGNEYREYLKITGGLE